MARLRSFRGRPAAPASDDRPVAAAGRLALPALFAGAAAIALAPILVRLSEIGPIATGFFRLALALPVLWLWDAGSRVTAAPAVAADGQPRDGSGRRDAGGLIIAGLCFAGDLALWHLSLGLTSVANATLFPNLAPVFVTLLAFVLFGERVSRLFLAGMTVAIAGAFVLMGGSAELGEGRLAGDALALATAVFYAGYLVAVARLRARLSTAAIMLRSGAVSAAALLVLAIAAGEPLWPASLAGWAVLAGLALVSHAGGQSLIAYALAHLPASFSAVGLLVQPALAALLAWILFGEAIGGWQAAGAAIIVAGVVLARRGSVRPAAPGSEAA